MISHTHTKIFYKSYNNMTSHQAKVAKKIIEADLWEVSLVVFPMNDAARVESVKGNAPTFVSLAPITAELKRILQPDPLAQVLADLKRL